jgi:hypothetical protein
MVKILIHFVMVVPVVGYNFVWIVLKSFVVFESDLSCFYSLLFLSHYDQSSPLYVYVNRTVSQLFHLSLCLCIEWGCLYAQHIIYLCIYLYVSLFMYFWMINSCFSLHSCLSLSSDNRFELFLKNFQEHKKPMSHISCAKLDGICSSFSVSCFSLLSPPPACI